jgi:hypothetical protein
VAADSEHLYWLTQRSVVGASLAGDTPITLADFVADTPWYMVAAPQGIYWVDVSPAGTIFMTPLSGGAAVTVASGQIWPIGLAVDASDVFWTDQSPFTPDGLVLRVPVAGGDVVTVASHQVVAGPVTMDEESVYWQTNDAVVQTPRNGGAVTTLVTGVTTAGFGVGVGLKLAVDDTSLYWLEVDGAQTWIVRMTPK